MYELDKGVGFVQLLECKERMMSAAGDRTSGPAVPGSASDTVPTRSATWTAVTPMQDCRYSFFFFLSAFKWNVLIISCL